MNKYTLSHPATVKNILKAMKNAITWGVDHVENKKGQAFLAVRYKAGKFSFTDSKGVDCGFLVFSVLPPAIHHRIKVSKGNDVYSLEGATIANYGSDWAYSQPELLVETNYYQQRAIRQAESLSGRL